MDTWTLNVRVLRPIRPSVAPPPSPPPGAREPNADRDPPPPLDRLGGRPAAVAGIQPHPGRAPARPAHHYLRAARPVQPPPQGGPAAGPPPRGGLYLPPAPGAPRPDRPPPPPE